MTATAPPVRLAVVADPDDRPAWQRAERIADQLALPLVTGGDAVPGAFDLLLDVDADCIGLREANRPRSRPLVIDLVHMSRMFRPTAGGRDPLVRAVGPLRENRTVADATAGLLRDAFRLACRGYCVTALERSPVLAVMIEDALARAAAGGDRRVREALTRLSFLHGDACDHLARLADSQRPDVVYLDPMFPPRRHPALSKKDIRLCRLLAGDDTDADRLFMQARAVARRRVVVKRHPHVPPIAPDPSHRIHSKMIRYDVYVTSA